MNYMEKIAEMLGVKLWEKFCIGNDTYRITKTGLYYYDSDRENWREDYACLTMLLNGNAKIEWKPKDCEQCWFVYADIQEPQFETFSSTALDDSILLNRGLIFKTRDEAINKMKELGWLD